MRNVHRIVWHMDCASYEKGGRYLFRQRNFRKGRDFLGEMPVRLRKVQLALPSHLQTFLFLHIQIINSVLLTNRCFSLARDPRCQFIFHQTRGEEVRCTQYSSCDTFEVAQNDGQNYQFHRCEGMHPLIMFWPVSVWFNNQSETAFNFSSSLPPPPSPHSIGLSLRIELFSPIFLHQVSH